MPEESQTTVETSGEETRGEQPVESGQNLDFLFDEPAGESAEEGGGETETPATEGPSGDIGTADLEGRGEATGDAAESEAKAEGEKAPAQKAAEPEPVKAEEQPKPEPEPPKPEPPKPEPEPQAGPTPEQVAAQRAQLEEELRQAYRLSPEEKDLLGDDLSEVLPKVAARAHVRMHESVLQTLMSYIPEVVEGTMQLVQDRQSFTDNFYKKWDRLPKHGAQGFDTVKQMVEAFRREHPQMPPDELIQKAGAASMLALNIPMVEDVRPEPAPQYRQPHRPANPYAARPQQSRGPVNPYVQYAEEDISDYYNQQ
jgi:hypothetical protein